MYKLSYPSHSPNIPTYGDYRICSAVLLLIKAVGIIPGNSTPPFP